MMLFTKTTFLATFALAALVMVTTGPSGATAGILDDFTKGVNNVLESVNGVVCVAQHKSEFDDCYNKVRGVYSDMDKQDNKKEFCCSYVAYRDCVEAVAYKHCGEKATEVADSIMNGFKKLSSVSTCDEYNNIIDCMDPVVRIVVIGVIIGVAIIILGCLIKVCCSCCR